MKINATKRMLALVLTLAMLIPNFAGAIFHADAAEGYTTGTATVYDLYDLTGMTEKTINGRVQTGTWDQEIGRVAEEHKENVAFKAQVTVGSSFEHIFIGIGMTGAKAASTTDGYIFEIQAKDNAPDVVIYHKKDASWRGNSGDLAFDFNGGTYVMEYGVVDLFENGALVGKRVYLKVDGQEICHYNDTTNPVTAENLGTVVGIYNEQNNITMATTYSAGHGEANVYDIFDLTATTSKQVSAWSPTVIGSFAEEGKEQAALQMKMTITNERHRYRFAVGNTADGNGWDPKGYGVEIAVDFDGQNHVKLLRNGSQIAKFDDVSGLIGEHVYEFGYRNITMGNSVVGKQVYLKVDGTVLYSYDDGNGYLTGASLGNYVTLNHIDSAALTMYTAYESSYGEANVYDICDLTGAASNTIYGTDATWDGQIQANVSEADKENMAFKTELTMGAQEIRLSLNAKDGASIYDPSGYAVYLYGASGKIDIRRNNHSLKYVEGINLVGTYVFETGIVDILFNGNRVGKHLYVKINDVVVCEYDDMEGYLTGDALGTKIVDFHYGAAIQMNSTYVNGPSEPAVYDLFDLTGQYTKTVFGRVQTGTWDQEIGRVAEEHKGNVAFVTKMSVGAEYEHIFIGLSMEGANASSTSAGYIFEIQAKAGEKDTVIYHKKDAPWQASSQNLEFDFNGTYVLEAGLVDLYQNGKITGKRAYLKANGEEICHFDDTASPVTTENLGTVVGMYVEQKNIVLESTYAQPNFVDSYNLTLGGSTVMNLRLDPNVIGDANATVTIEIAGEVKTYALSELAVDAEGLYVVNAALAAAQMQDEVVVTVTANGATMTKSYSVAGYAKVIMDGEGYTAEQKAVVEAMLHYGAAAQNYFSYNLDNLANAGYTDAVTNTIGSAYAPSTSGKVSGITYYGSSLLMKENISLRHYLKIEGDISGYSFTFNGEEVTPVATTNIADANYYVQLDNILPNELDGVYVFTVSKDGNSFSLNYSPMSYIQRMSTNENMSVLVQQLYDYHVAAKALAASKVVDKATVRDLYEIGKKL